MSYITMNGPKWNPRTTNNDHTRCCLELRAQLQLTATTKNFYQTSTKNYQNMVILI